MFLHFWRCCTLLLVSITAVYCCVLCHCSFFCHILSNTMIVTTVWSSQLYSVTFFCCWGPLSLLRQLSLCCSVCTDSFLACCTFSLCCLWWLFSLLSVSQLPHVLYMCCRFLITHSDTLAEGNGTNSFAETGQGKYMCTYSCLLCHLCII